MNKTILALATTALALGATSCGKSDRTLIKNKGSDTMLEVAQSWAEHYRTVKPEVNIAVTGGGSGGGIASMINGTIDIANCSRAMKPAEIEDAKKHGHSPVQHHVGYDGIAIFVHKDNPIESITLEQLKQIYIDGGTAKKWSDLGVKFPADVDDTIVVISRQSNSGTYEYFREGVLGDKANFRLGTRDLSGSKDVVDAVVNARTAIGYSGLAYATPEVKMVPVVTKSGSAVMPSIDSVIERSYPISRPLFMYTDGEPEGAEKEYLDWIKSDAGQKILLDNGYPPLRKL